MTRPLVDKTTDALIAYISENDLSPGDKLPNEYSLAESLNIGRSTLREAVRSLVSRNILEVRQGSGTYVSNNMGITDDPLGFNFISDTHKLTEDLFALRYILEPEVAFLAAKNRTDEQLVLLERTAFQIKESMELGDLKHFELDIKFHSIIAKMSGNIAMNHLVPVINQSITLYDSYYTNEQIKMETIQYHQDIVDSIRNKDMVRAKFMMQMHIGYNQRMLEIHTNDGITI